MIKTILTEVSYDADLVLVCYISNIPTRLLGSNDSRWKLGFWKSNQAFGTLNIHLIKIFISEKEIEKITHKANGLTLLLS